MCLIPRVGVVVGCRLHSNLDKGRPLEFTSRPEASAIIGGFTYFTLYPGSPPSNSNVTRSNVP